LNLVTGATGIIGSHLVLQLLQRGESVVACRQKSSDLEKIKRLFSHYSDESEALFARIKWIDLDIRDIFAIEDSLENVTNVYHCAGFVSFNNRDKKKLDEVNEIGTKNVVNACLTAKNVRLCHVSSLATLHNLDYRLALDEKVFWKKSGRESAYAVSKYNAEREVWRGMEEGLKAVIVNPGVVLGAGFWKQSSSAIFEQCYKGNRFFTGGTTAYISAMDTARTMISLMEKQLFGNRYILIEDNYTYFDIFSQINKRFSKPAPVFKLNRFWLKTASILESAWLLIAGGNKKITRSVINSALNKQVYSNQKIRETLGINFEKIDLVIDKICKIYAKEHIRN